MSQISESAVVAAVAPRAELGAVSQGLRSAGIVLAGSALVAVCAHVSIPLWFTPVPVTLQPFAVLVLGLLLVSGSLWLAGFRLKVQRRSACASSTFFARSGLLPLRLFSPSLP